MQSLRQSPLFWSAIGYDLNDRSIILRLIQGSVWFTGECSSGVYGCSTIEFKTDGTFVYKPHGPPCDFAGEASSEDCEKQDYNNRGTYSIENSLILKYNSGAVEKYHLPDENGKMRQQNGNRALTTGNPDPCSA